MSKNVQQESTVAVSVEFILDVCAKAGRFAHNRQAEEFEKHVKFHMENQGMTRERAETRTFWGAMSITTDWSSYYWARDPRWWDKEEHLAALASKFKAAADISMLPHMQLTITDATALNHLSKRFTTIEEEIPRPQYKWVDRGEFTETGYEHPPIVDEEIMSDPITDAEAEVILDEFLAEPVKLTEHIPSKPKGFWATLFSHL